MKRPKALTSEAKDKLAANVKWQVTVGRSKRVRALIEAWKRNHASLADIAVARKRAAKRKAAGKR